ncbi:flagellar hook-length control protein FliK [Anaerobranca gottschalkii]|uniref:Hook-length control protein FliK n=1 Tax=Anaerobranca gottschalkii DSM 13577 TaxID=1120990 RepID=A0A1H9ZDZ8_9FIRM|nr:flagellar hook-length control protein FliK [Anaerobranca gottschalkii]SES79551.1 hook-length control protein FliK [Anaerobranca gottschalkii DSM 13577]
MKVEFETLQLFFPLDKKENEEEIFDLSFLAVFQQQLDQPLQQLELEPLQQLELEPLQQLELEPLQQLELEPLQQLELEPLQQLEILESVKEPFSLPKPEYNLKTDNNLSDNDLILKYLEIDQYKEIKFEKQFDGINLNLHNKDNFSEKGIPTFIENSLKENLNNNLLGVLNQPISINGTEKLKMDSNVQVGWQKFKTGLFYRSEGNIKEVINNTKVVRVEGESSKDIINTDFPNSINEMMTDFPQNSLDVDSFNIQDNFQTLFQSSVELLNRDFQIIKEKGTTKTTIKLHPEELGEVKIHLSLDKGILNIKIVASEQLGFNYLRDNEQELQQRLTNNSFEFEQVNLEFVMDDYRGNEDKGRKEHQVLSQFKFNVKELEDLELPQQISDLITTKYNYKV